MRSKTQESTTTDAPVVEQPTTEQSTYGQAASAPAEAVVSEKAALAEAARGRATQLMTEKRYAEAKSALEEAEELEAEPPKWKTESQKMITALRSRLPKRPPKPVEPTEAKAEEPEAGVGAVDKSLSIVSLYSKIAAAVGLLPGGLLNWAAILAVQITMVWRIAVAFGKTEGKEKIRGSVLSLVGSIIPTGIGHGAGVAIAAIPAVVAGTVVYFVVTPVLAYAMTRAVGAAYIMHFESGGTLLTFDAKAFGEHFLNEFQKAGGVVKHDLEEAKAS